MISGKIETASFVVLSLVAISICPLSTSQLQCYTKTTLSPALRNYVPNTHQHASGAVTRIEFVSEQPWTLRRVHMDSAGISFHLCLVKFGLHCVLMMLEPFVARGSTARRTIYANWPVSIPKTKQNQLHEGLLGLVESKKLAWKDIEFADCCSVLLPYRRLFSWEKQEQNFTRTGQPKQTCMKHKCLLPRDFSLSSTRTRYRQGIRTSGMAITCWQNRLIPQIPTLAWMLPG